MSRSRTHVATFTRHRVPLGAAFLHTCTFGSPAAGNPKEVLPAAIKAWGATRLCFEFDSEPYGAFPNCRSSIPTPKRPAQPDLHRLTGDRHLRRAARVRDEEAARAAAALGCEVKVEVSHTLYDPRAVVARCGGKAPVSYQGFLKVAAQLGAPPKPAPDPPAALPPPLGDAEKLVGLPHGIPVDIAALGYPPVPEGDDKVLFKGGEMEGLKRMRLQLARLLRARFSLCCCLKLAAPWRPSGSLLSLSCAHRRCATQDRKQWLRAFEKPNTAPTDLILPLRGGGGAGPSGAGAKPANPFEAAKKCACAGPSQPRTGPLTVCSCIIRIQRLSVPAGPRRAARRRRREPLGQLRQQRPSQPTSCSRQRPPRSRLTSSSARPSTSYCCHLCAAFEPSPHLLGFAGTQ